MAVTLRRAAQLALFRRSFSSASAPQSQEQPITPDFTTSVNVGDIRLGRPKRTERLRELKAKDGGSLIPETLKEMATDSEFQLNAENLKKMGQKKLTAEEKKKRMRALDSLGVPAFETFVGGSLSRNETQIFQINIGLYCNQACSHCHVESSPQRKETMSREVADRCLHLIRNSPSIKTVDITGGAPELNEQFRYIVSEVRAMNRDIEILDRCNLTVLSEPGQEDLAKFLADNKVQIVASLPCYSEKNVNMQRGSGVFDKSISGLLELNQLGYGVKDSGLSLNLVYNPSGAFLPPDQEALEAKYKEELWEHFGIEFSSLFTITNMPIKRFADFLYRRGELEEYMALLVRNFNISTVPGLMCMNHCSVSWSGNIFDCDFNQQLDLPMAHNKAGNQLSVFDIENTDDLLKHKIQVDSHCFGCTSGKGSSCQGQTI